MTAKTKATANDGSPRLNGLDRLAKDVSLSPKHPAAEPGTHDAALDGLAEPVRGVRIPEQDSALAGDGGVGIGRKEDSG